MFSSTENELAAIADSLYEQSDDDDIKMAELLHELPEETAHTLLTSNLTNAVQAYIYAFNEVPDNDLYDLLLLNPSYMLNRGIVLKSEELAEIVFGYDKTRRKFLIAVNDGERIAAAFEGEGALEKAAAWVRENCAE
ncbi:MAG TPA: hypothetical protein O0X97_05125 [Methanocorpusculum sp.]|nr:hypothetical protein [Methanocorpusculum sp.]